ncbi:MAG: TfuA-like protein [Bacteroidota bacterium]
MPPKSSPILFAGPSLSPEALTLIESLDIQLMPPVYRGNVEDLTQQGYQGTLIVVDGYFREYPAVGHLELRKALEAGIRIFGLSSMGAIRAYEMQAWGMIGYGKTFQWFQRMEDFQDDEVALLHGPGPDFWMFSEPLVHMRECLEDFVKQNWVEKKQAAAIIADMKSRYFGDRLLDDFIQQLSPHTPFSPEEIKERFPAYRTKMLDLLSFLQEKPWR